MNGEERGKIIRMLKNNEIGVLPTDTLYGLVGKAFSKKAVERICKLKKRNSKKPFIILISSLKDLDLFDIKIDEETKKVLRKYWPGKVSIILPCDSEKLAYLHMGAKNLAFRIPNKKELLEIIKKVGPLVAPSANHPGEKPAATIEEAKRYFGDSSPTTFKDKKFKGTNNNNKNKLNGNYEPSNSKNNSLKVVGDKVDFYIDGGKLKSLPSTLIKIENGKIIVLREGAAKIN